MKNFYANGEFLNQQLRRDKLRKIVRSFFGARSFLEVETPHLVTCPGTESILEYFETKWSDYEHSSSKVKFLRSSPELHMKQLLADGASHIFQTGSCFRNVGEKSNWHHPEFWMLEWYQPGSLTELINITLDFLRESSTEWNSNAATELAQKLAKKPLNINVFEAFKHTTQVDLIDQDPDLAQKLKSQGLLSIKGDESFEVAYFKALIERIEPFLFSHDVAVLSGYPPSQAALAKVEGHLALRFEIYVGRVELCNGFEELTGRLANKSRIQKSLEQRQSSSKIPIDSFFVESMTYLNWQVSGNALGLDRWLMLLEGLDTLDDVSPFRNQW